MVNNNGSSHTSSCPPGGNTESLCVSFHNGKLKDEIVVSAPCLQAAKIPICTCPLHIASLTQSRTLMPLSHTEKYTKYTDKYNKYSACVSSLRPASYTTIIPMTVRHSKLIGLHDHAVILDQISLAVPSPLLMHSHGGRPAGPAELIRTHLQVCIPGAAMLVLLARRRL